MVEVKIFKDGFTSYGHADYAPIGQDIVCSAISALTQSCILALRTYCVSDVKVSKSGGIWIRVRNPSKKSALCIGMMVMGLQEIEKKYPEHIRITEEWKKWMD